MFSLTTQKENTYDSADELTSVKVQNTVTSPTEHCICKIIELLVFAFKNIDAAHNPKQRTQQGACRNSKMNKYFRTKNIKHFLRQTLMEVTRNSTTNTFGSVGQSM
jgi:hypothetical protein